MQIKRNLYHSVKTLIKNVFLLNFANELLMIFEVTFLPYTRDPRFKFLIAVLTLTYIYTLRTFPVQKKLSRYVHLLTYSTNIDFYVYPSFKAKQIKRYIYVNLHIFFCYNPRNMYLIKSLCVDRCLNQRGNRY